MLINPAIAASSHTCSCASCSETGFSSQLLIAIELTTSVSLWDLSGRSACKIRRHIQHTEKVGWVTGMHIILQPPKCFHKITVWVKSTVYTISITIDIMNYPTKPVVHVGVVLLNVLLCEFVVHIPTRHT